MIDALIMATAPFVVALLGVLVKLFLFATIVAWNGGFQ